MEPVELDHSLGVWKHNLQIFSIILTFAWTFSRFLVRSLQIGSAETKSNDKKNKDKTKGRQEILLSRLSLRFYLGAVKDGREDVGSFC